MSDINKSSLSVSTKNKSNLIINPYNPSSSFNIQINNRSVFSLFIHGFNLIEKYLVNFNHFSGLVAYLRLKSKMNSTITNHWNLIIGQIREKLTLLINFQSHIVLEFIIRSGGLFSFSISSLSNFIMALKQKIKNTINIGNTNVNLFFYSGIKDYNTLAYFDIMTLAEMDALLLKELDYDIPHLPLLDDDGKTLIDDDGLTLIG